MTEKYNVITIDKKEFLAMVGELPFSDKQINLLMQATPEKFIKTRPIPGGGSANFVETHYVIGMLNLITGYRWDFDVLDEKEAHGQIVVKGKLTIRTKKTESISKTQYGRAIVKMKSGSKDPLDYGNDFKAATSDAIKKCASLFGVAWDIYGKEDMREVQIMDSVVEEANKDAADAEVLTTDIGIVQERVTAKLDGMSTIERMRSIKTTGHSSLKSLSESNWRRLDRDLGTDKTVGDENS